MGFTKARKWCYVRRIWFRPRRGQKIESPETQETRWRTRLCGYAVRFIEPQWRANDFRVRSCPSRVPDTSNRDAPGYATGRPREFYRTSFYSPQVSPQGNCFGSGHGDPCESPQGMTHFLAIRFVPLGGDAFIGVSRAIHIYTRT